MKGELQETLTRLFWVNKMKGVTIEILHRGAPNDRKSMDGKDVESITEGFLILRDGTMIPIHRIRKIWERGKLVLER